jgi:uncharacterized protein (TIGR02231 family)
MAKNITGLFLFIFLSCAAPIFAAEIKADSRIREVTIYSGDALIKRIAQVKLSEGSQQVIFPDIIPEVDEGSLRVSGEGQAAAKILGAFVKKEFLKDQPADKVKLLQDKIQALEDEIRKLEDSKRVLADEKNFLDSIRLFAGQQLPKEMVTKMPAARELSDMLLFLDSKLKDNYAQVVDAELKARETRKQIDVLRRELSEISGWQQKMKRSIVVDIEAAKAGSLNLEIAYRVKGAYWYPIYDARVSFDKQETELVSFAQVKQSTGEDWNDVNIVLSTAKVNVSGSLPEPEPWFLRPYQPRQERWNKSIALESSMPGAKVNVGSPAASFDAVGGEILREVNKAEYAYSVQEEKGVSVVYKITKPATVKSDGAEYKLPVSAQVLKSAFSYSAYPRLSPFAYLGSKVTNAKELQLLGGRVNVFLDGDFVGVSQIKNVAPQEEFDLYLGVDENVKVKRELLEKKVDETLIANIAATTKRTIYRYKVTLENYKPKNIKAKLFEAIPISQDDRIKVKMDKVSLEPKEKDYKDKKGVWLWELELAPKEKKEIFFSYVIEHPREMEIEGL